MNILVCNYLDISSYKTTAFTGIAKKNGIKHSQLIVLPGSEGFDCGHASLVFMFNNPSGIFDVSVFAIGDCPIHGETNASKVYKDLIVNTLFDTSMSSVLDHDYV